MRFDPSKSADFIHLHRYLTLAAIPFISSYSQDFNTLANSAGTTTNVLSLPGWALFETGTAARVNQQYATDTGGSGTGDTYSYGAAGSVERDTGCAPLGPASA